MISYDLFLCYRLGLTSLTNAQYRFNSKIKKALNGQPFKTRNRVYRLNGTVYFARSQATRANVCLSDRTVLANPYRLNISIPLSLRMSVRMRNSVSRSLTLTANFTFSGHLPHLLVVNIVAFTSNAMKIITQQLHQVQGFCYHFCIHLIIKILLPKSTLI